MQVAFQQLAKQLRSLSLALGVVAVQPFGAAYRRTALFPPVPHPLAMADRQGLKDDDVIPRCLDPVEMLVQLEGSGVGSGRWIGMQVWDRQTQGDTAADAD